MKKALGICGLAMLLVLSLRANASAIQWTLQDGTLLNNAALTGSFIVGSNGDVTSWSITTGADPTAGFDTATTYSSANGGTESPLVGNLGVGPTFYVFQQGNSGLYLTFLSGTTGTPQFGTLPVIPGLVDLSTSTTSSTNCPQPCGISNEYVPSPYATREVVTGEVTGVTVGTAPAAAPELDPADATIGLTFFLGALAILVEQRRKPKASAV